MINNINYGIECWYRNTCRGKSDNCRKSCIHYKKMNFLLGNCGVSDVSPYLIDLVPKKNEIDKYKEWSKIKNNILDFVKNGNNLFISSEYHRVGKTTMSVKLMYKYFDELPIGDSIVPKGYFINVPEFLLKLRSFDYWNTDEFREINELIKNTDIVIWDNITGIKLNIKDKEHLLSFIECRTQKVKTNIFNGKQNDKLENILGKEITQKLYCGRHIHLTGISR